MGTKVAPTYACLVLGYLESNLYQKLENKDKSLAANVIKQWKRYIDDCFIFCEKSFEDLQTFAYILNSLHKDITFEMYVSEYELPVLDILIIKRDQTIVTDIFYKITDFKQYLNFKSCHPKHTKINIPFSLARRICTIVFDKALLGKRLSELAKILLKRKYPKMLL